MPLEINSFPAHRTHKLLKPSHLFSIVVQRSPEPSAFFRMCQLHFRAENLRQQNGADGDFPSESRRLTEPFRPSLKSPAVKRFVDKIERAGAHRLHCRFDIAENRD